MADIFISYAREDQPVAAELADHLERAGWDVWWDRDIPVGKDYDLIIDAELAAARCVIVLWTKDSVISRNVKDEANEALNYEKLLPIQIGAVRPPMGFRMIQSMIWQELSAQQQQIRELLDHLAGTIGPGGKRARKKPGKAAAAPPEPVPVLKKKAPARKPRPKAPAAGITEKQLVDILLKYKQISSIYFAPMIPASKEANARKSCFIPDGERMVALIDLTVFGASDDCLAFTTDRIFHKNINSKAIFCKYLNFPNAVFRVVSDSLFTKTISINSDLMDMSGLSTPLSQVVTLLNEIRGKVRQA